MNTFTFPAIHPKRLLLIYSVKTTARLNLFVQIVSIFLKILNVSLAPKYITIQVLFTSNFLFTS